MPAMLGGQRLDKIALRWHDLANRRLEYFVELFQSGRWRHYYTQESFALRMLDVMQAVKNWDQIAARAAPERGGDLRPAA
ncbi:MAG: TIGR03809 family protein [Pseudolabrys sp.]